MENQTKFKVAQPENEADDFSNMNIKTINVFELSAEVKKILENKTQND